MFPTAEVRWFYRGAVPRQILAWFRRGGQKPVAVSSRVDYYLRLADGDGDRLGIKLREGRIEIKQRHGPTRVVRLHDRVAGQVEHWRKWSFPLDQAGSELSGLLLPPSSWIGVEKARRLRTYRVGGDDTIVAVSATEYPERGCSWELTGLRVRGEAWWSLGFEAFGEQATLRQRLLLVAEHVLCADEPPVLEVQASFSYPRWLLVLARQEDWDGVSGLRLSSD